MKKTILITGANGRMGQAAIKAFANRGWSINTLVRKSNPDRQRRESVADITEYIGDVRDMDAMSRAATGCEVILHAANPSYEHWPEVLPASTRVLIDVARSVNATILLPGNVYPFGETMPSVLSTNSPHNPSCEHGLLRAQMEQSLRTAAKEQGVQTLLVRAGNYIDGRDTGNWFESYMCKKLDNAKFMYPGDTDCACEWIYLPDVAEVMAQLAEIRDELGLYEDIGSPGFSVTGSELHNALESVVGKSLKLTAFPWKLVKLLGWFLPKMKAVHDLRYLYFVPHAIDGSRLKEILPHWRPTSLKGTLYEVVGK